MKRALNALLIALAFAVAGGLAGAQEKAPTPAAATPAAAMPAAQPVATPEAQRQRAEEALKALPPELRTVMDKLDEANRKLEDVSADVTYERAIPLLDEKQVSHGTLVFKKPARIILKLGKPRNEAVYTNGKQWWVVSEDEKQVEIYEAANAGHESQETAFLSFGYGSGTEKLLEEYTVELVGKAPAESDAQEMVYRLKFTPRERPDRPVRYAAIEVEIADKLWLPSVLVLHESGGEIVHTYRLSKVRTNTGVKDEAFNYEPPRGYTILRPQE
jgi:outer membrane lipoprotein-sorting protein